MTDCHNSFPNLYEKLQARNSAPAWLKDLRQRGMTEFENTGFPTTKDEAWRFTNVKPIAETGFIAPSATGPALTQKAISEFTFNDMDCHSLVFVDGKIDRDLSRIDQIPENVVISGFSDATATHEALCSEHLAAYCKIETSAFSALNTAFISDGAVIYIPDDMILNKPVHLLFINSCREDRTVTHPRNVIVAGANSRVNVVESYASLSDRISLTNTVTEIYVADHAVVNHTKLQRENQNSYHIGSLDITQCQSSDFVSNSVSVGAKLTRNNINVFLNSEHAVCTLNGLYLGHDRQLIDNHTRIDHAMPNCNSYELYKGILDDNATGVFNGKIHVHPDAQKTDAKQTNRVLLLSDDAKINTKPELEIYANDVKCTHGATIGQLDQEALFYLRARGIDLDAAHRVLTRAFASDALERIVIDDVRAEIDNFVSAL